MLTQADYDRLDDLQLSRPSTTASIDININILKRAAEADDKFGSGPDLKRVVLSSNTVDDDVVSGCVGFTWVSNKWSCGYNSLIVIMGLLVKFN